MQYTRCIGSLEHERNDAGIFKLDHPLVADIGHLGMQDLHIPEQVINDINEVTKLCKQRAAVHRLLALPVRRLVIPFIPVPVTIDRHRIDLTQPVLLHELAYSLHGRIKAILLDHKKRFARLE